MPDISDLPTTSFGDAIAPLGVTNSSEVAELFLKSQIGDIVYDVSYTGSDSAAFVIDDFVISGAMSLSGGILLSSGGLPGSTNTSAGFSVTNGTPGDTDLNATASAAFSGSGSTFDASVIEFKIDATDLSYDGISFDVVFGSDEFPEFSSSSFIDIAAIYVNGVNVALFNDNPLTPLSVIDENLTTGNFNDNVGGTFGIEWDGFSNILAVRAAFQEGENTIKIAIADTGDTILDSGLYINNLELITGGATGGGVLSVVNGTTGDDVIEGSINPDEANLFGGNDVVKGTPSELNNDIITGFGVDDVLCFIGTIFTIDDVVVTFGSAILDIDTNGDGVADTKVTLEGEFEDALFDVESVEGNTNITFEYIEEPPVGDKNPIDGTSGWDTIDGTNGADFIRSFSGNDTVNGLGGADEIYGGRGDDMLDGGFGFDTIYGEEGGDVLYGRAGDDSLFGGAGSDLIYGGIGNDYIEGNAGHDTIYGEAGADEIRGGDGLDQLFGGAGNDKIFGGNGNDLLKGDAGDDLLVGGAGADEIRGGDGLDQLFGNSGSDLMRGGNGNDYLNGGTGNDNLAGGNGADILIGGEGTDILTGNAGYDIFLFETAADSSSLNGIDTITDFTQGFDKIDLSAFGFSDVSDLTITDNTVSTEVFDGVSGLKINLTGSFVLENSDFLFV